MAPSNDNSELSDAPTIITTPFSIAARSTTSSKLAKHARNAALRRSVVSSKSSITSQNRPASQTPTLRTSDHHAQLVTTPLSAGRSDTAGATGEVGELSEDSAQDVSSLQTPGMGSSVTQASGTPLRRPRAKTSHIHEYISTRGDSFVCNRCSRVYKSSGGTGAISRHLKKAHSIDSVASGIAKKRIREGAAVDAAILREAEINSKAEEKRREQLMGIGLDKTTLKYLYLQWVITQDVPSKQVRNKAFRAFLEYVNPVANRMISELDSTVAGIEATCSVPPASKDDH
ncbi:MAG: hypothetical protein Q9161_006228 [Pseudevernia consocians]